MSARRRRRSFGVTPAGAAWSALLIVTAIAVVMAGLTAATRAAQPALALRVTPYDAPALARRASEVLLTGEASPAAMAQARALARAALARDATVVEAWRTLGLVAPEGSAEAHRLLNVAQMLSRRDLPTQLALIEYRVQRGDILGALRHYDIILRVSAIYDSILFPILAEASTEPAVRGALAAKLTAAPMWRRRFLSYLVGAGPPSDVQADLFAALAAAGPLPDRDIVAAQASSAALAGQYTIADRLYAIVSPSAGRRMLRDGGFDAEGGVPPYDWQFDAGDAFDAVVSAYDGNRRIEIISRRGDSVRAARQLLSLPAGRYHLSARYGAIDGTATVMPRIAIICASSGVPLTRDPTAAGGVMRSGVTVPTGCPRQWIEIGLPQDTAGTAVGAWIDDITVR